MYNCTYYNYNTLIPNQKDSRSHQITFKFIVPKVPTTYVLQSSIGGSKTFPILWLARTNVKREKRKKHLKT